MTLLLVLIPLGYPQVPRSSGVGVVYKFVECSTVLQVKSSIDLCVNVFGASYEANALKNNRVKKYRPLCIPFPISYAVNIHHKFQENFYQTVQMVRNSIGWAKKVFSIYLTTYHPSQYLHTGVRRDFGAPNPDRHQREHCQRL